MRFLLRGLFLAALMVPGVAAAQVQEDCAAVRGGITSPIAIVSVNGVCVDLSDEIVSDGKLFRLAASGEVPELASIILTATFDPDPTITFGFTTTNLVPGPTTFALLLGTPIVPGFYTTASSTGGVSVTSSRTSAVTVDNSALHPTYISGYGTNGAAVQNLGVDLGTDPCTAAAGPSTAVCNQGSTSNTFGPTFYDNLEVLLTYTQTGLSTVASWSGAVTLDDGQLQVPEVATVTLLTIASLMLGVVGFARRQRHQS